MRKLSKGDAKIFEMTQKKILAKGGPTSFMDDVSVLIQSLQEVVPNGKVHVIGKFNGQPIFGSGITRFGLTSIDGVTNVVRAIDGKAVEVLGRLIP